MFARYLTYLPGREQGQQACSRARPPGFLRTANASLGTFTNPGPMSAIATGRGCSRHGTARAMFPMEPVSRSLSTTKDTEREPALALEAAHCPGRLSAPTRWQPIKKKAAAASRRVIMEKGTRESSWSQQSLQKSAIKSLPTDALAQMRLEPW